MDDRAAVRGVRRARRFGLRCCSRLYRSSVHRPDRLGRLPVAPSARGHVRPFDDRRGDDERQPFDTEVDLAGRHPQEVMSARSDDPVFTALWEAHRRRMLDLAFRMLLHFPDAEDVVQEAFARLARTDIAGLDDPEGWLVVVTSRLCLDKLRSRRRRPTDGLDLVDDPFDPHALDPSDQVALADNVSVAMHALLERLSPAERTSFVLHDVFQYSFEEVAAVVGRSP